jgi:hypothetical protein
VDVVTTRFARLLLIFSRAIKIDHGLCNCLWVARRDEDAINAIPDLEGDTARLRGNDPARLVNSFGNLIAPSVENNACIGNSCPGNAHLDLETLAGTNLRSHIRTTHEGIEETI